ncbi:hypothetical protein J8281_14985 [Aquimarina sp. U1-2]|uniref:hypothetical protein n=1 Tax=Aquimarina sp. U1-2 TaxID=2823141 RepID=UPI001AECE33C|nr:hypothetical protein [Aquimarina sp. U1-2]MBP2833498.1 hypothetical protein [Aquimarina sp. U1-2]
MKQPKEKLKSYFETGDKPTQDEFADLIDSYHHIDNGLLVTDVDTLDDGNEKITFSNGASVLVQASTPISSSNNKIRVIDLGVINPFRGVVYRNRDMVLASEKLAIKETKDNLRIAPSDYFFRNQIEREIVNIINNFDPPLVVADDENIVFEFDIGDTSDGEFLPNLSL